MTSWTLGFLRHNTKNLNSASCLLTFYSALKICSILNYGSIIWNPYLQIEIKLLELVQKRFLSYDGFLLKIDHPQHYYEPVMDVLNLSSLEERRLRADHNFLFKLIQGKIDAPRLLERINL